MEYSETEKQMLREILPGIATQLRGSLANIHAALGRLAPEQARDASTDTDRSAAILCQSYYRILRVVNNLSDAPMLGRGKASGYGKCGAGTLSGRPVPPRGRPWPS